MPKFMRIRLEYFTEKDFEQLIKWMSNPSLLKHWAGDLFRFPLTHESLVWYLEDTNVMGVSEAFVYKAVDIDTGETVGHISLGALSVKNSSARISRVFSAVEGKGICKQMVSELLEIGFKEMRLHRIGLSLYNDNPGALKCYENCGLKIEGISRDVLKYENSWWSMIEMSILQHEYLEKNKMENA